MAKTLEQIMEEQMAQMMAQMMKQSSEQTPISPPQEVSEQDDSEDFDYSSGYDNDEDFVEIEDDFDSRENDFTPTSGTESNTSNTTEPIIVSTTSPDGKKVYYNGDTGEAINGHGEPSRQVTEDVPIEQQRQTEQAESFQAQIITELTSQIANLKAQIEAMKGNIKTEKEFGNTQEMKDERANAYNKVFNNQQPFEKVVSDPCTSSFCGNPFTYQRYEESVNFGEDFKLGETFEDSAKNFRKISKNIVRDIEKMFGGLNRITDIAVISDILIFNGVSYEPILPDSYVCHLPLDVQNAVRDGQFAWLFDFEELRNMPSLTNLMFDNTDFVFKKVRIDLTARRDFEPKHLFIYFKKLMNIQIGEYIFNRNNQDEYDDVFHKSRRSTEIADAVNSWGVNATKSTWCGVKDCYTNPNTRGIWKALSVVGMTGVAVTTTAGLGTFKAGRLATKLGKSFVGGLSSVIQATKENL